MRYKEIPHVPIEADWSTVDKIAQITGTRKVPAVETANGIWLFYTTPMLQWFEHAYPSPSLFPPDPALQLLSLLIEDYGDEWLWRPAMWWRWLNIGRETFGSEFAKSFNELHTIDNGSMDLLGVGDNEKSADGA